MAWGKIEKNKTKKKRMRETKKKNGDEESKCEGESERIVWKEGKKEINFQKIEKR